MPSASDRRAWPLVGLLLLGLGVGSYFAGVGVVLQEAVSQAIALGVRVISTAFSVTIVVDLVVIPVVYGIEWMLWQFLPEHKLAKLL